MIDRIEPKAKDKKVGRVDKQSARPARRRLSEGERQDQILRATLRVVAAHGHEQASLARIAEEAGVSKGLVSHHFRDRDDLMIRAIQLAVGEMRNQIAAQLDLSLPVPEVIRAALRHVAHVNAEHEGLMRTIRDMVAAMRWSAAADQFDQSLYEETYQAQENLFQRGQAEGSLRAFDTRVMAATYQGAIDTMLAYFEAYPETDIDQYADALADLLIAAIIRR